MALLLFTRTHWSATQDTTGGINATDMSLSTGLYMPNTTDIPDLELPSYPDVITLLPVRISIVVVQIVTSLVAIIGNGLVLVVIIKRKKLRKNPTILFILNLAFSDLVSCLLYRPLLLLELCLPFIDSFTYPSFHLEQCKLATFLQGLFAAVGFLTMVAISQERLLLIAYPLKAKNMCSTGNTKKVLATIWLVGVCSVLPVPLRYSAIMTQNLDGTHVSLCGHFEDTWDGMIYITVIFLVYFAVPLVVLTLSYAKIFHVLYRRPHQLSVNESGGRSMEVRRSLAKMMLSVSIIFALCWGPEFFFCLYLAYGGSMPRNGFFLTAIVEFLPIISSSLNPFVYTLNSRTFRLSIKSLVLRRPSVDSRTWHRSQSPCSWRAGRLTSCNSPQLSINSFRVSSPPTDRRHTSDSPLRIAINSSMCRRQISCPSDVSLVRNGNKPRVSFSDADTRQHVSDFATAKMNQSKLVTKNVDSVGVCKVRRSWNSGNSGSSSPENDLLGFIIEHPDETINGRKLSLNRNTFKNKPTKRAQVRLLRYVKKDPDADGCY